MEVRFPFHYLLPRIFGIRQDRFHGDPSLLDSYRQRIKEPNDFVHWIMAAWCWDHYPVLIGGNTNPTGRFRRAPGDQGHLTVPPSSEHINTALDIILGPVLDAKDKWVLTIPRAVGHTATVEARALLSISGGAAIVLPMGIFGMVYVLNELVSELKAGRETHLSSKDTMFVKDNYAQIIAYLLLQREPENKDIPAFLMQLDQLRYTREPEKRGDIWSISTAQQLYVLLHELGHLVKTAPTNATGAERAMIAPHFSDENQEVDADSWAAGYLRRGRDRTEKWPYWLTVQVAMLILFGAMDLMRESGFMPGLSRDMIGTRLAIVLLSADNPSWPQSRYGSLGDRVLQMAREVLWGEA